MRLMPARTAVCTAADIECDLPVPRPPRNNQHHDRSGGGSCASRAAKTQSPAASSPSPRISSSASSGVISLMSRRNWCMRSTSRKKRSAMAAILFHSFAIDDSDLSRLLLSTIARIFSVVQQHVAFLGGIDHSAIADDVPLPISKFIVSKRSVSYLRVSTTKQGETGLGVEARREAVRRHLFGHHGEQIAKFVEVESGRRSDRPEPAAAMIPAKK